VPTATTCRFNCEYTVRSRAYENQLFVCFINRVGNEYCKDTDSTVEFCGSSSIVAPNGDVLAVGDQSNSKLLVAVLDYGLEQYKKCTAENPYLDDRRPQLYKGIE